MKSKVMILVVCIGVLAFLLSPYRNLLGRFVPYFLILLCPLAHIFMMRHHGGDHGGHCRDKDDKDKEVK